MDRFARALRRLQVAIKSPHLDDFIRLDFPLDEVQFEKWIERCEAEATVALGTPKRSSVAQKVAARMAARLLLKHGQPLTTTRHGVWCHLASVLYGEELDFYGHCRAVKKDLTRA